MKRIINIPENTYNALTHTEFDAKLVVNEMRKSIVNGVPIPDDATNGDVIKALFKPNWIRRMDDVVREEYEFNEVWWNAPYQKGGKE